MKDPVLEILETIFNTTMATNNSIRTLYLLRRGCGALPPVMAAVLIVAVLATVVMPVTANSPPRFLLDGKSEIVLRLPEGPQTPVGSVLYRLRAFDPDGDRLTFLVQGQTGARLLAVRQVSDTEADLILKQELDREVVDEYSVTLLLTDGRLSDHYVSQSLLILVDDVNDNKPVFSVYDSSVRVQENSAVPRVLAVLEATDRDQGPFGQVMYSLRVPDTAVPEGMFSVSTERGKGVLRLHSPLDYERNPFYQVQVLATDRAARSPQTATAAFLISVEDVSDTDVEFVFVPPVVRLREDVTIGTEVTKVVAVDGDRGVNAAIRYTMADNGGGSFHIDPATGSIYTSGALDREARLDTNGALVLIVAAQEANASIAGIRISTEITIVLTDINDQTPSFTSALYTATLPENSQQGLPLTFDKTQRCVVSDFDQGTNGSFRLYLEGAEDIFEVTPTEVVNVVEFMIRVRNAAELDFEKRQSYNFTIVAEETNLVLTRRSLAQIRVQITDENDNVPVFQQQTYYADVAENVNAAVLVATVSATDIDSSRLGSAGIRYTNITGPIASSLKLDPLSGAITINSNVHAFDREKQTEHRVTVVAQDDLGRGHMSSAELVLRITDVNDNAPLCDLDQGQNQISVLENSLDFANKQPVYVKAYDLDEADTANSELNYRLAGAALDNFDIDASSGELKINYSLDYEALQGNDELRPFNVTVIVSDSGIPALSTTCSFSVLVRDRNDFAPRFEKSIYRRTIFEDAVGGTKVIQVLAVDEDASLQYNTIVYRIQHGALDKFVIDPTSGVISVSKGASLDPDLSSPKTLLYNLSVLALDSGVASEQLTGRATVLITVDDINNKLPVFEDPGVVSVLENVRVGTVVTQLVASDPDTNPVLRYSLDHSLTEAVNQVGAVVQPSEYNYTNAFRIHPIEGVVRTASLLDREMVETVRLVAVVQDLAALNQPQSATVTLTITLLDVNDNAPIFRQPFYRQSVTENAKIGTPIARIMADDADVNRTVHYRLQGVDEITDLVHLDSHTGELVVAKSIDYELYHWLNVTVRATDDGVPSRHSLAEIFIQVLDENDNNPRFVDDISQVTVREDTPPGTVIVRLEATDEDSGEFGHLTYILDRRSSDEKFAVNADTGEISVAGDLNRETRSQYLLVLQVWDNYQFGALAHHSRNAFKHITVSVADINDERPIIRAVPGCLTVTEFHDPAEVIGHVTADDADDSASPNSWVDFAIVDGNDKGIFSLQSVDNNNVNIIATRSLVGFYGNYSLNIQAQDRGYPANTDKKEIQVCVTDFNDHAPVFVLPASNGTIRVPENTTVGSVIAVLSASDADIDANAAVRYRLLPDQLDSFKSFQLDDTSGQLVLRKQLDREHRKLYEIRVEAYDLGVPTSLSSDLDLKIYVSDVNDHKPKFLVDSITLNFTENQKPGSQTRQLPGTVDADLTDDIDLHLSTEVNELVPEVCFFIVGGNEDNIFSLEPMQHTLTTNKQLDREERAVYELVVMATDDCATSPTADMSFDSSNDSLLKTVVYVDDLNDNRPYFLRQLFSGGVSTDTDYGTEVVKLQAVDADCCENGQLFFSIKGEIQKTLSEGLESIGAEPFILNNRTGVVTLNFDPQKNMKGYFDFVVTVHDTSGKGDESRVFIYLLRNDQRVRFVLRMSPQEARQKADTLRDALGSVSGTLVNIDQFSAHSSRHGSVDRTRTDLYMHFVNRQDHSILDVPTALALLDSHVDNLDPVFKEFNVLSTQAAAESLIGTSNTQTTVFSWLIGSCIFLVLLLVTVVAICANQRTKYQRMLRATTAAAFGSSAAIDSGSRNTLVPNTNMHALAGSNPIWLTGRTHADTLNSNGQAQTLRAQSHNWMIDKQPLNDIDISSTGQDNDFPGFSERMDSLDDNALNLPSMSQFTDHRQSQRSKQTDSDRMASHLSKMQNTDYNELSPGRDCADETNQFVRNILARRSTPRDNQAS